MKSGMKTLQQLLMKKKNYHKLRESIRMMKTQGRNTKIINGLKKVKEKTLIKFLDKMHKYKTMISCCLKCMGCSFKR